MENGKVSFNKAMIEEREESMKEAEIVKWTSKQNIRWSWPNCYGNIFDQGILIYKQVNSS